MALPCDYLWFDLYTRTHFRYRYDEEVNHFIEAVVESATSRTVKLGQGTSLWRAQRGCRVCIESPGKEQIWKDDTDSCGHPFKCRPFSVKRMKPKPEKAKEGRVNPKGIPLFPGATQKNPEKGKVPPWKKRKFSVGGLGLKKA